MRNSLRTLFIALLITTGLQACAEGLTQEKRAHIENLLKVTGATALGKQMALSSADAITQTLRSTRPDIPKEVVEELPVIVGQVFDENTQLLENMIIPLYHKYFTEDEIKEMLTFYTTPLGQKVIETMPSLIQDSMAVGQMWARMVGPQVEQRIRQALLKKGIEI